MRAVTRRRTNFKEETSRWLSSTRLRSARPTTSDSLLLNYFTVLSKVIQTTSLRSLQLRYSKVNLTCPESQMKPKIHVRFRPRKPDDQSGWAFKHNGCKDVMVGPCSCYYYKQYNTMRKPRWGCKSYRVNIQRSVNQSMQRRRPYIHSHRQVRNSERAETKAKPRGSRTHCDGWTVTPQGGESTGRTSDGSCASSGEARPIPQHVCDAR